MKFGAGALLLFFATTGVAEVAPQAPKSPAASQADWVSLARAGLRLRSTAPQAPVDWSVTVMEDDDQVIVTFRAPPPPPYRIGHSRTWVIISKRQVRVVAVLGDE